ncbi:hypothetical protein BGZ92_002561 [Podila epicladia]|nr:hypothetical protein BGZ92_002561 [Podila epicladia]
MSESKVVKEFQWGAQQVRMETGEIARQAGGAVLVNIDETIVLATVVGAKQAKPGQDFFPLTVDYMEKSQLKAQAQKSGLDLIVAGTETGVLMVEAQAQQLSEEVMLDAVVFAHEQMQTAIQAIDELAQEAESKIVRDQILSGEPRIDGRSTREVRPISIRTGVLPRTHGSALFTRGETQALAVATLGTKSDEQIIDAIEGEYRDRFMLHYNMPPFATGEVGRTGTPKRREIGHGRLAKRALAACLPSEQEFGYTIRVVSEITESNGDEDHLGDMDFKVAGTEQGITALQMDIKIQGARDELSAFAPRMVTMKINPEKIRDVIGKGGSVIRGLTEETGTNIDIGDDGTLTISGTSPDAIADAQRRIKEIVADVEVGQVYKGTIIKLLEFGAIVNVMPGRDGLLHKSEITREQAPDIQEGKVIDVKVIQADGKGRFRLSAKAVHDVPPASNHPEMEHAEPEEDFAPATH